LVVEELVALLLALVVQIQFLQQLHLLEVVAVHILALEQEPLVDQVAVEVTMLVLEVPHLLQHKVTLVELE
jgi:hypothetical protein|tara:strand:- start:700 stop:912 length:213 start_codon:yes stop_codon:yes gene_type:complete